MKKKARAGKLAESQSKKLKAEKSGHMKKLKAKSFIINGKIESQKRKFYHTAFQLCVS